MNANAIYLNTAGKFAAGLLVGQYGTTIQLAQKAPSLMGSGRQSLSDQFGKTGVSGRLSTRTVLISVAEDATLEDVEQDVAEAVEAGACIYAVISNDVTEVLSPGMLARVADGSTTLSAYEASARITNPETGVVSDFFVKFYYSAVAREDDDYRSDEERATSKAASLVNAAVAMAAAAGRKPVIA